ncbi:MAG: DHHA1 domain-containing protein [archaeon]
MEERKEMNREKSTRKQLKKAEKFIENLKENTKILIVAHSDGDGIISAAITTQAIQEQKKELKIKHLFILSRGKEAKDKIIEKMKKKKVNTVIFLDYTPNDKQVYKEIEKQGARTLTIDHHPIKNPFKTQQEREKHVYVNPQEKGTPPSASVLCHLLYEEMDGEKNTKPWAMIGAHSDTRMKQSRTLLNLTQEEKELYIPNESLHRTLVDISNVLLSAYLDIDLAEEEYKYIKKSIEQENPVLIQEEKYRGTKRLYETMEKAEREKIRETKENPHIEKYEESKLIVVPIKSKLRIKSKVAEQLRLKYPDYIIAVKMEKEERCLLSIRGNNTDLNRVIPKACEGIEAQGGGHPNAAGAAINKKHYPKFIENLKKQLKDEVR